MTHGQTVVNGVCNTNGSGYWSKATKAVAVLGVNMFKNDASSGDLHVYFDTTTWDVDTDGLIYTDEQFETEVAALLTAHSLDGNDIMYSEQGMQGDDFVSFDVGRAFIKSWQAKFSKKRAKK